MATVRQSWAWRELQVAIYSTVSHEHSLSFRMSCEGLGNLPLFSLIIQPTSRIPKLPRYYSYLGVASHMSAHCYLLFSRESFLCVCRFPYFPLNFKDEEIG